MSSEKTYDDWEKTIGKKPQPKTQHTCETCTKCIKAQQGAFKSRCEACLQSVKNCAECLKDPVVKGQLRIASWEQKEVPKQPSAPKAPKSGEAAEASASRSAAQARQDMMTTARMTDEELAEALIDFANQRDAEKVREDKE